VVVPLVLIDQWEKEAKTHSTEGSLSIYKYYGAERLREDLSKYDLVITTYGTISSEYTNAQRKNNAKNVLKFIYSRLCSIMIGFE
jgi:SNF2 family DNA or RNA helicase